MKLQVLIADADPDFQRTMTQALSREGDMEAAGVSSDGLETLSPRRHARMLCCWTSSSSGLMGSLFSAGLPDGRMRRRCSFSPDLSMPPSLPSAQSSARHILSPSPATPRRSCSACGSAQKRAENLPRLPPRRLRCPHIWKAPSPTFSTRSAYRRMSRVINICVKGSSSRSATRTPPLG